MSEHTARLVFYGEDDGKPATIALVTGGTVIRALEMSPAELLEFGRAFLAAAASRGVTDMCWRGRSSYAFN